MDILNALVKHYDAMAAAGNATPFGWTHKFAQYAVELNDDGEIDRIFALGDLSDKKNKGEEFKMPTRRPRSGKLPIPYVFCDDAEHLLGKVGEASNLVRYTMMRDAVFMLRDLLGHSKALDVVYKFYETWDPEKALDNKCVSDVMEAKGQEKKTFILFYNGVPVFDDETFRKSYAAIVNKYGEMPIDTLKGGEIALLPEPIKIRSMISGNIGFKARLFRAITAWGNKKNGPVTNTLLSNNKANTEYFGRQQGNAIPITMQDEHKIYEAAPNIGFRFRPLHSLFIQRIKLSGRMICQQSWKTRSLTYAVAAVIKLKLSLRQMNQVLKPLSESLKKQNSIRDESRFFRTLKRT